MDLFLIVLVGGFSGLITGLTGASGVMVVVPLISILFRFPIHEAIGTSLVVDVLTSMVISVTYFKNDNIAIKPAVWVVVSAVLMAQVGARFSDKVPERGLDSGFAISLIVFALIVWSIGIRRNRQSVTDNNQSDIKITVWRSVLSAILAGGTGFLTGFMGAGGGILILTILLLVNKFPMHKALGTSILIMALTALSGVIGHATLGNVNLEMGITLAISAALSGILCARFANKINERSLSRLMGAVYMSLGIVMMIINLRS